MKPDAGNLVIGYSKRRAPVLITQAVWIILLNSSGVRADWQVKYDPRFVETMRKSGHPIPSLYGHYATRAECMAAIQRAGAESGDPYLAQRMEPVGHDDQKPPDPLAGTDADDKLYYDDPVPTGGLQPRGVDPNRLEEALAKIRELDRKNKESKTQELENDKNELLNGAAAQKLKNPFADDPNVVDLRDSKSRTPMLLRERERFLDPQETVSAKKVDRLRPGDVLLLRQDGVSMFIPVADNLLAEKKTWDVSHTVIYLKEVNGEKHYLDSQPLEGSRIILQDEFLERYGNRETQVARLAEPLDEGETKKLYTSAVEMAAENRRNRFGDDYGLFGKSRVCSEADLKLLMDATAGRRSPISVYGKNRSVGIDVWPADYLRNPQTFEIRDIPPQFPFSNRPE